MAFWQRVLNFPEYFNWCLLELIEHCPFTILTYFDAVTEYIIQLIISVVLD